MKIKHHLSVYCIYNKINKRRYIGETLNLPNRWMEHITKLVNNKHDNTQLQHDFNYYGINAFEFTELETAFVALGNENAVSLMKAKFFLLCREHYYIYKYDTINNGYNCEDTLFEKVFTGKYTKVKFQQRYMNSMAKSYPTLIDSDKITLSQLEKSTNGKPSKKNNSGTKSQISFHIDSIFKELEKSLKSAKVMPHDAPISIIKNKLASEGLLCLKNIITDVGTEKIYQATTLGIANGYFQFKAFGGITNKKDSKFKDFYITDKGVKYIEQSCKDLNWSSFNIASLQFNI